MLDKHTKDLNKAKELFFSWKLHEAYAIFRRFFDRLPFSPQAEHALYLSYFIRCLLELGKERELNFYLNQIESLSSKWQTDELYYQLAEVSILGNKRNLISAKEILTKVISNPDSKYLHTKAKMLLAYCYDCEGDNVDACRRIIDSIGDSPDRPTQLNLELWRIKILRDEGKLDLAQEKINKLFEEVDPILDWYAYFSGKIILGGLHLLRGDKESAGKLLLETRAIVDKSPFRTLRSQLSALEEKLNTNPIVPEIFCENGIKGWTVACNDKKIELSYQTVPAKIFELFTKKEWIDKSQLAKKIFKKEYEPASDDSKIHYQIHCLRKILLELDFDLDPISFEDGGYRLIPKVTLCEGEV
jgi:tetratricopeptide (TPR) repeat protein